MEWGKWEVYPIQGLYVFLLRRQQEPHLIRDSFILALIKISCRRSLPFPMMLNNATIYDAASKEIFDLTRSETVPAENFGTT